MDQLETIADEIRAQFNVLSQTRDEAINRSRALISLCAKTIRAIHREEWDRAEKMLQETRQAAETLVAGVADYPDLLYAGYTQDGLKEYVEAHITYALVRDLPLPTPQALGTAPSTWLNGLAEAATELRRRILDIIRHGHSTEAERLLAMMSNIYDILVTIDFNDSITGGLRRRTDTVRAVLERTRGDVTTSIRQADLEQALELMEARLKRE